MCRRMTIVEFDELLGIARAIEYYTPLNLSPDWPACPHDAFPNELVPILIAQHAIESDEDDRAWNKELTAGASTDAGQIVPISKRWGFETADRARVIFNTRIETADELPLWKGSLEQCRCIVPVQAFYETHAIEQAISPQTGRTVKQLYRFTGEEDVLLLAGIWKGDRFSVITTTPNASVSSVHDRMPLILSHEAARAWLLDDWHTIPKTTEAKLDRAPLYPPQASVDQPRLF